jgi:hypothetical protein
MAERKEIRLDFTNVNLPRVLPTSKEVWARLAAPRERTEEWKRSERNAERMRARRRSR